MVNHMSMSFIQQAFVKYLKKKKKTLLAWIEIYP